jgi:hypothetical protein
MLLFSGRPIPTASGQKASREKPMDRITMPPAKRIVRSNDGRFRLELSTEDGWRTRTATARLRDHRDGEPKLVWEQRLPHELGPRFVLISNQGAVVLLDENINVASRYAVSVVDPQGKELATHSFDAVAKALVVTRQKLAAHGKLGVWISSPPRLDNRLGTVTVSAGDKRLSIRLRDGSIYLTP